MLGEVSYILWFGNYLSDRCQRVCMGQEKSDWAVIGGEYLKDLSLVHCCLLFIM